MQVLSEELAVQGYTSLLFHSSEMNSSHSHNTQHESAWLETILRKAFHESSISRVVKVTKEEIGVKGDNYVSCITRVTLEIIQNSGRKSKKTLILKCPLDLFMPMPVFKLEVKVYENILSEFNALMNEFQDPNEAVWCEMIGHQPYDIIALEDLKAANFKVADRKNLLDMNHTLLVLNGLGRLHGISHVLIQRGVISPNDLGVDLVSPDCPFASRIVEGGFDQLACVMEEFWPPEWKEVAKKFAKLSKVAMEKIKNIMDYTKDTFLVMNHGDCWTCNMMFKYSPYEESRPIAVKFIDWPFANVNSYILDITRLLGECMHPEIRRQNIDILYRAYQKSLASTLEFYGMPGIAPTLEQIYAEAKRAECLEILYSTVFLAVVIEDFPGFYIDKTFTPCEAKECFNADIFKTETFRKLIEAEIKRWVEEGII
ncbi:hypothetical protein O3M35_001084 [Rhynocoris fuscipes]|uniref:CHK kinase-like domain-containing protein n=1 Tax=Rhynocoris fuscipes TaxID=488301 RepID=A0AAW1DP29_9HEMI